MNFSISRQNHFGLANNFIYLTFNKSGSYGKQSSWILKRTPHCFCFEKQKKSVATLPTENPVFLSFKEMLKYVIEVHKTTFVTGVIIIIIHVCTKNNHIKCRPTRGVWISIKTISHARQTKIGRNWFVICFCASSKNSLHQKTTLVGRN